MHKLVKATLLAMALVSLPPLVTAGAPPADLALSSLNIDVTTPLGVRHAGDGSGRLFIIERDGTIRVFRAATGLASEPFLDISDDVDTYFEGGLLGLAFHPNFADNGYFYVNYTRDGDGGDELTTVIERFTVSASNPDQANLQSRQVILTVGQPAGNHNGGDLHFGSDGYLYIALGDGGGSSRPSQDPDDLLGKMLRIAPCDTPACATGYDVPSDNPNVDLPGPDEIWASGFRNPYRFSFDRQTGDLFIADVGAGAREEVSLESSDAPGGANYGWNCREGNIAGPGNCSGDFVEPVLTYAHTRQRCSITGGYRYRGCIAGLRGTYVYGDYCTGEIFFGTENGPGDWSGSRWRSVDGRVFGFGEDEGGELYAIIGSDVRRFESAEGCETGPSDSLFISGFESL